ncbi:hypothetical protein ACFFWD_18300 [Bradyrhizobium erythrophlei]|uniref:hypothetical protein n=1 Tax=Bradyrhizobium erythrophlei TaxID=1437360 RepID=UPI0035F016E5
MADFVALLHRDGQADNRYQLFGYSRQPEDLWKLDQVVFSVRRTCADGPVVTVDMSITAASIRPPAAIGLQR